MSLKIKHLTSLPTLDRMKQVAGKGGMERIVATAGIADYEFTEGFEDREEYIFEEDGFVISSLLFAKDAPEKILPAIRALYNYGTAGFAYKSVIFDTLPDEVLKFADENNFPIFVFGRDLYFEDIIYRVIEAVHKRDSEFLSEENLKKMIDGLITQFDVEEIAKGVSLLFKKYVRGVYIKASESSDGLDVERAIKSLSLSKTLKTKAMIAGYGEGLFIIITSNQEDKSSFDIILKEILEVGSISSSNIRTYKSKVHRPFDELDMCIRESWHTFEAEKAEGRRFDEYEEIGTYKYLIPLKAQHVVREFSQDFLAPFFEKEDLMETLKEYVKNEGDVIRTAEKLCCHQNTVRYRLSRAKALAKMEGAGDAYFYEQAAAAIKIKKLNDL